MMQFDLFGVDTPLTIEVAPQTELPKVLAQHPHGVQLGSHFVPYQLRRAKRRSIGFLIAQDGLCVSAPRWVNVAEINAAIVSKQRWILKKLHEQQNRPAPQIKEPIIWREGTTLPFLGQQATLQLQASTETSFDSATGVIALNLPSDTTSEKCQQHVHTWLMQQARHRFNERLPYFANLLRVNYHSFSLTNARTLWGSCSPNGKMRLNWRLIHLAPHIIDYVIAHELAHLREMNHSPRFWAWVGRAFPNYVAARKELRTVDMRELPEF